MAMLCRIAKSIQSHNRRTDLSNSHQDISFLERCLELARQAQDRDEVPVGALVAHSKTGEIVSEAFNLKESLQSPIAHAEVVAVHRACQKLGRWRLTGYSLYSSLEPCVMCSGVLVQARLDRVIWSARDAKGGGESLFGLLSSSSQNHRPEIHQCSETAKRSQTLLKEFFKKKRR